MHWDASYSFKNENFMQQNPHKSQKNIFLFVQIILVIQNLHAII